MPKTLRKLVRIFSIQWGNSLQYRGDILIWTLTETASPLIALAVWFTVTSQSPGNLEPRDTLTYYILSILIITATNSWLGYFLTQEILDGSVVRFLTRPFSVFLYYASNNIVEKIFKLALPIPIAAIVFLSLPQYFSPSIYDPSRVALAIMSVILGATIGFLADALLSTLAFWLEDVHQIFGYHYLLWTICSGILIPYTFLPEATQTLLSLLPYRYILSAPLEILISSSATLLPMQLISIQLAWIMVLAVSLRFAWQQGLKRYAIPGQ